MVLGDLLANANSAKALDHPLKINGQDIQTAVNNNSKLTADVQVNTLKASTDLSDLSVYPSLNATYGLSGKYVASPNDAANWNAILQVSSYPDNSRVRLTFIDTGALGSIYTRTYTSGNWSTWQKIVIDSDTIAKASTAGKLAKAVSINGTKFDGSSDIAVNAANDSSLVHKSGNESISGDKTFTGTVTAGGTQLTDSGWKNIALNKGITASTSRYRIKNGICYIQMVRVSGGLTNDSWTTLPAEARPKINLFQSWSSGPNFGNIVIQPDGDIHISSGNPTDKTSTASLIIDYPVD